LVSIVAEHVLAVLSTQDEPLKDDDIVAVTEAVVAKAEGNYADISHIAQDIRAKFGDAQVGLVFPILSRNRFLNILKGIAAGASHVHVLLSYPHDEVGNPIMDVDKLDDVTDSLGGKMVSAAQFRAVAGAHSHGFTGVDYVELYESVGENVSVHFSNDPRDILKLTKHVLVSEIHNRARTRNRLLKAGAKKVYTLSDILSAPVDGSGHNPDFGVLGSNLSSGTTLKLFPARAPQFVSALRDKFYEKTGTRPEIIVYGDGAFKDPLHGIWELADPVVSPGFTPRLSMTPNEIKIKLVADDALADLRGEAKRTALLAIIEEKKQNPNAYREGTTPRIYADLVGSLCDLMGGSGDKGTPVILVRGYFDDYSVE
jgi:hypothetical protein